MARGMALFGPDIHADIAVPGAMLQPDELSQWLADRGDPYGGTRAALAALERRLPEALADEEFGPMVGGEAALLLGQVLTATVDGARWIVWPNGHPVVRVGTVEVDVTEVARDYIRQHGEPLTEVVDRYQEKA